MSILPSGSLPTDRPPSASPGGGTPTNIQASQLADGVLTNAVRRGALFGGIITASLLWAPTTTSHSIGVTVRMLGGGTLPRQVIGRQSSDRLNVVIGSDGRVDLRNSATVIATSGAGTITFDNSPHVILAEVTATSVTLTVNGDVKVAATFAATAWGTSAQTNLIGTNSGGTATIEATLSDARFIDPADDTNTAVYTLDGPSGFENSHPGSTVADATVTGNVSYALVPSSDGGRPVKVGREVYLHYATRAVQTISGGEKYFAFDAAALDESGAYTANSTAIFIAPAPGVVKVATTFTAPSNADPTDAVDLFIRSAGAFFARSSFEAGDRAEAASISLSGAVDVDAGDAIQIQIASVAATTSISLSSSSVLIDFYPTLT